MTMPVSLMDQQSSAIWDNEKILYKPYLELVGFLPPQCQNKYARQSGISFPIFRVNESVKPKAKALQPNSKHGTLLDRTTIL